MGLSEDRPGCEQDVSRIGEEWAWFLVRRRLASRAAELLFAMDMPQPA